MDANRIRFGKDFIAQAKALPPEIQDKLYINFIAPLQGGYDISELQGKYKPSWIVKGSITCPFRKMLVDHSRGNNLYHYHFGHPFYRPGRDPDYPGDESNGIIHTQVLFHDDGNGAWDQHVIFRLDEKHPTPFSVPMNLEH